MSLLSLWKANKAEFAKKQIQQLVSLAGDGALRDNSATSLELREYLASVASDMLGRYLAECLENPFTDSGLVLQDIVNELGSRLDCEVSPGLYRGKSNDIGFDGIWKFPDDYCLVVEVKATDVYNVDLNKVSNYRKELIKRGDITDRSSILMVVGRKETDSLEAQVRGSRYAWDIRIVSADALLRLVKIKESADNKATINKIRSILTPLELTKLDFVVDLLMTTAEDIKEVAETEEDREDASHDIKKEKKFTPVSFNNEVAERVSKKLQVELKVKTRSLYIASDKSISVRSLVSKAHEIGDIRNYWYAFHPYYKESLEEYKDNYIAFGCGSPKKILLFPLSKFITWLPGMNITSKADRMYSHVFFNEAKNGQIKLTLKKGTPSIDVMEYLI